ncbi:glycosyltransferase [Leptolyngbya sp. NK1-12]|uniref:Glycosyltransferase n=2 Tax=Leptolyngbya sp. NK1-12 TaxID=2547451 RepID=A0AA96WM37_9CYAN|nr:glycosyltransferase [Leptolyngbya sp. NK1-12]
MKLMVYSHDAFGLGNIRRMLAICESLLKTIPQVSILVVSGSPALHSLRLPAGLDYIKLPCVGRDQAGEMASKYLDADLKDAVKLRSDLILAATRNFKPDLFLVDKKPDGLESELKTTLNYLRAIRPQTKLVLLLRDILDRPEATIQQWQRHGYYQTIANRYDQVWVVGTPAVFDVRTEYRFPREVAQKVRFCGYIRREPGLKPPEILRQEIGVQPNQKLVLVTPGGGADGYRLASTYLASLAALPSADSLQSVIVSGPEMPAAEREALRQQAANFATVQLLEFTDDLTSYMAAADLVVSMGGYNTITEILSLQKRAIVIPRTQPVAEQWIRAERMAQYGLFRTIHPDDLTPTNLMELMLQELQASPFNPAAAQLDMNALPRITEYLFALLRQPPQCLLKPLSSQAPLCPLEVAIP